MCKCEGEGELEDESELTAAEWYLRQVLHIDATLRVPPNLEILCGVALCVCGAGEGGAGE